MRSGGFAWNIGVDPQGAACAGGRRRDGRGTYDGPMNASLVGLAALILFGPGAVGQSAPAQPDGATAAAQQAPRADAGETDEMARLVASMRTSLDTTAMARALAFYEGRVRMLDRVAAEFPTLKEQALAGKKAMQEHFGPGREALKELFLSLGEERKKDHERLLAEAGEAARAQAFEEAQLRAAFDGGALEPRNLSLRIAQMFLILDERHQKNPRLALDQGHVLRVPIPGNAKEASGTIDVPKTFGALGEGPDANGNMSLAFASLGGAIVNVHADETPKPATLDQAIEGLRSVKSDALTMDFTGVSRIETALGKVGVIPVTLDIQERGEKGKARGRMLVYTTPTHMVSVTLIACAMEGPNQDARLEGSSRRFQALFDKMIESLRKPEAAEPGR